MMNSSQTLGRMARSSSRPAKASRGVVHVKAAAASEGDLGFKTMRAGVKEAADESVLTPRFYTT